MHGQIARRRNSRTSIGTQIESPEVYAVIAAFETMGLCTPDSTSMQANYAGLLEHMGLTVEELQGAVSKLNTAKQGGPLGPPGGPRPAGRGRKTQTPLPERTGSHFLQDMFETFSALNSGPEGSGGAFLTAEQVTTDAARLTLRERLPQMFSGVRSDGAPVPPTAEEVRNTLDPEADGQITVMDFIKAARNMGILGEKPKGSLFASPHSHTSPRSGHMCTAESGGTVCGEHRVQGGDFCQGHTCSITGCKRNAVAGTKLCQLHTGRSSLHKPKVPKLGSARINPPSRPRYAGKPEADPLYLMFCNRNSNQNGNMLSTDEQSSGRSIEFLREQLPNTFNKFDLEGDGVVKAAEIMAMLDADGNGSVSVLESLRVTKDLRRAEAVLADPAASEEQLAFRRPSVIDSIGQRGASPDMTHPTTAAPVPVMPAGDHLFKVCTAIHMGGEGMLSRAELEEEIDVVYLAGHLASVLEHFDPDVDGTAEAGKIMGSLTAGVTLNTKDFLKLARQVREQRGSKAGKVAGKMGGKKRKGAGPPKSKKGSPKKAGPPKSKKGSPRKAGPPSRHYTPPEAGTGASIVNSGYSTHAI